MPVKFSVQKDYYKEMIEDLIRFDNKKFTLMCEKDSIKIKSYDNDIKFENLLNALIIVKDNAVSNYFSNDLDTIHFS